MDYFVPQQRYTFASVSQHKVKVVLLALNVTVKAYYRLS